MTKLTPVEWELSTTKARNLSDFPAELLQLIFFFLLLGDLKSFVLVCKRWNDVGERSKLWILIDQPHPSVT